MLWLTNTPDLERQRKIFQCSHSEYRGDLGSRIVSGGDCILTFASHSPVFGAKAFGCLRFTAF